ncbi:MAG: TusE/DsrC/DsvC family sulfur relay protein [Chromatiaceae bacterium]|nr:TusE/DsrC/DsvC family sulfur relay protein [Chromatiaceae bacterium]
MLHAIIRGHDDTLPGFPFAPSGWQPSDAEEMATEQGIELSAEHFETLRALQEYFFRHDKPDVVIRELHDALDERFHTRGGMKHLYKLFPGGPVAQGCALAGLSVPPGALNRSFGSVQ